MMPLCIGKSNCEEESVMHQVPRRTIPRPAVFIAVVAAVLFVTSRHAPAGAGEPQSAWKAGVVTVVTTPEQSMWMAGYAARTKPSEGKVHDLHAKALALEDTRGTRFVIVTVDLIGFPREFRDAVEKEVATRYGLRPEALLLNASHTHCGPEIRAWRATQAWDLPPEQIELGKKYSDALQVKIIDLVGRALQDLAPAQLSYVHGRAAVAMNRRSAIGRGYTIAPNADGPVDHDVPVLLVATPDGKTTRAILFGYACHNTTLDSYQFCGDYAGFAQQYVEEAHPGAVALFMIGCGGDQNPTPRRTLEWAKQHGRALANGVEQALVAQSRLVRGPLKLALGEATLELSPPPSVEELKRQAASRNKYERRHAEELLSELEKTGRTRSTYPYLVQVAQFGDDLTMVGLAGEVVVDYSLRLKAELAGPVSQASSLRSEGGTPSTRAPALWVAGYCNEVFGYVPSERVLQEGGYEARDSILYYDITVTPFMPSVEKLIVDKVHELVRKVRAE
jgi:neutral ceramidase